jgi:hypothetical protein
LHNFHKKTAELLTPYPTKFGIPVALEATATSKEVLVRHPAHPGISLFFYQTLICRSAAGLGEQL